MFIAFKLIFKHMNISVLFVFKQKLFVRSLLLYFSTHIFVRWLHLHFGFYSILLIKRNEMREAKRRNEKRKKKTKKIQKNGKCLWLFIIAKILIRNGWLSRSQLFFLLWNEKEYDRFAILRYYFAPSRFPSTLFINEWLEMEMSFGSGYFDIIKFCIVWFLF